MKRLSPEQVQSRKDKAVRFVRDVLDDPERAAEIEDESVEDYAERRNFQILNPSERRKEMATKRELEERIQELEEENEELQGRIDEILEIVSPMDEGDEESEDQDDLGEE